MRCILAALHGDQNAPTLERSDTTRASNNRRVVLLSFLRPLSLWTEVGKKAGLDITSLIAKRQILYIDGLDVYYASASPSVSAGPSSLRSHALNEVQNVLQRAIEASYKTTGMATATADMTTIVHDPSDELVLIIDGLDFLIASQPDVTATTVSKMLTTIRQRVHSTILTISSDGPLLHGNAGSTTPLEKEHQAFIATLAHQSQLVMQLRCLDTGTAKDISGVIRVSHGGTYEDESEEQSLVEGEWLYKVSGDGSVRVWVRGE